MPLRESDPARKYLRAQEVARDRFVRATGYRLLDGILGKEAAWARTNGRAQRSASLALLEPLLLRLKGRVPLGWLCDLDTAVRWWRENWNPRPTDSRGEGWNSRIWVSEVLPTADKDELAAVTQRMSDALALTSPFNPWRFVPALRAAVCFRSSGRMSLGEAARALVLVELTEPSLPWASGLGLPGLIEAFARPGGYSLAYEAIRRSAWALVARVALSRLGPPGRSPALVRPFVTPTVVGLADAILAGNAWGALPVLADALEEAGCTDPMVLGHCRTVSPADTGPGDWVVDLITAAKEDP